MIADKLKTAPGILPPFRTFTYDTLKLYTKAHGMKTVNLIINMENDEECIFNDDGKTLAELGVENETEISYFKLEDYIKYKEHPDNKW
ncbi:hypothetical protein GQ42DRAFT_163664 [Ramicandelaber brevisporus]|nr:hypothetical protein GQ42DRAFT_163664 [Ramicandelaber brevisporus]